MITQNASTSGKGKTTQESALCKCVLLVLIWMYWFFLNFGLRKWTLQTTKPQKPLEKTTSLGVKEPKWYRCLAATKPSSVVTIILYCKISPICWAKPLLAQNDGLCQARPLPFCARNFNGDCKIQHTTMLHWFTSSTVSPRPRFFSQQSSHVFRSQFILGFLSDFKHMAPFQHWKREERGHQAKNLLPRRKATQPPNSLAAALLPSMPAAVPACQ